MAQDDRRKSNAALLSVASNTLLIILKLLVGMWIGSVSIISEAAHSSVDLLAAIIAIRPAVFTNHCCFVRRIANSIKKEIRATRSHRWQASTSAARAFFATKSDRREVASALAPWHACQACHACRA